MWSKDRHATADGTQAEVLPSERAREQISFDTDHREALDPRTDSKNWHTYTGTQRTMGAPRFDEGGPHTHTWGRHPDQDPHESWAMMQCAQ